MAERRLKESREIDGIDAIVDSVAAAYGYESLKEEQKSIILTFVKGKDVFGCLPPGFGKSACFLLLPSIFDRLHTQPSGTNMVLLIASLSAKCASSFLKHFRHGSRRHC